MTSRIFFCSSIKCFYNTHHTPNLFMQFCDTFEYQFKCKPSKKLSKMTEKVKKDLFFITVCHEYLQTYLAFIKIFEKFLKRMEEFLFHSKTRTALSMHLLMCTTGRKGICRVEKFQVECSHKAPFWNSPHVKTNNPLCSLPETKRLYTEKLLYFSCHPPLKSLSSLFLGDTSMFVIIFSECKKECLSTYSIQWFETDGGTF